MSGRSWMGSAAGVIAILLTGIGTPIAASAQEIPAPSASPQDSALYSYLDDADALLAAMGTSPPDYGFRFDGIDCWAWSMSDGYLVLAEPLGDDYRFYVFAPDDDHPFFVGDQFYAYGFEGRALAAIYGANGDLIAWNPSDEIAAGGAWLSDRGNRMRHALDGREPVVAPDWADSIGWFGALELRFDSWRSQPGWLHYRTRPGDRHHRDWRKKLDDEGARRRQRSDWFDRWRRGGYRGAAPQSGGGWTTKPPGRRPGKTQGDDDKGGRIGRPRPVAPPTPGIGPSIPRPGDGGSWPGRGPRPPAGGQPGQPARPDSPKPPRGGQLPVPRLPVTIVEPPAPVPPPVSVAPLPPMRGVGRPERPLRSSPQGPAGGTPPVVKNDLGRDAAPLPPQPTRPVLRSQPAPLPPPVLVVPRRDPVITAPPIRRAPPPPPPAPANVAPPPPLAGRAIISLPASRPAPASGPVPTPRPAAAPRPRSDGPPRPTGKGKDR